MTDSQDTGQAHEPKREKWRRNTTTGEWVMPPLQEAYLLEQCVAFPPSGKTDLEWAAEHGVAARTLRRWKTDERFRARWEELADERNKGPEWVEPIIQNMYAIATSPGHAGAIKAAETLLRFTDRMKPPEQRVTVETSVRVEDMSDEELAAALASFEQEVG